MAGRQAERLARRVEGSGYFGGARTRCYSGPMRSVAWAFCLTAFAVAGPERDSRIQMAWGGMMPDPDRKLVPGQPRPKPLLVYVPSNLRTRDQERFENALQIQQFVLCSRFFQCVRLSESQARQHPLLRLKFKVPCLIVFNSSLKKRDVVRARASAMKAYSAMRRIGYRHDPRNDPVDAAGRLALGRTDALLVIDLQHHVGGAPSEHRLPAVVEQAANNHSLQ